ncbi:hypothetical protein JOE49_003672 [Paenibacillus sp. PvR133]|nr:hypothetical protein [Paenibacillus sp. PvR133]
MIVLLSPITKLYTVAFIVTLHIILMIGLAMVWVPAQTNGLNQLPSKLYPHGTAVMNTVQQVIGAVATAVSISILSSGMDHYLHTSAETSAVSNQMAELANAMTVGSEHVFWFAMIVAVIGLVISFFIRRVIVSQASAVTSPH